LKNNILENEIKKDDFYDNLLNIKKRNEINELSNSLLELNEDNDDTIKKVDEIQGNETDIATFIVKNKWQVYKDIANIFTKRSQNDNDLKKKYSKILIIILIVQLLIMNIIFILRGANVLIFSDTTFNIFVTATIAEVFTLVTIIVKYLFTDNLTKLLSNILTEVKEDTIDLNKKN